MGAETSISAPTRVGQCSRSIASRQRPQLHSGTASPVCAQVGFPAHSVATPRRLTAPAAEKHALAAWDDHGMAKSDESAAAAEQPGGPADLGRSPAEAIAASLVRAPTRGNRRLEALLENVNADAEVRTWWHMAQVQSERLGMSDHSWVHVQIVLNIALRLLRLLVRGGTVPAMVSDHAMRDRDAEVVVAAGALLHDVGMSIHRSDHEAFSLFLAERKLRELLADVYRDPAERTVVIAESLHAIIGHRRKGQPYTLEAGVVRVADALDMAHGRSRLPVESGQVGIHAISAAAIDAVEIAPGEERPVRIQIALNNSAGIFQVDDLLATKLRGTPLEGRVEVVATVEGESEKRLLTEFRIA
jgi:metal-dependent HD superfamily phosphatase/phosphodiesterase